MTRTDDQDLAPHRYWEQRYAGDAPVWSGRPNPTMVDVVSDLTPGTALDLGCGEGGDVVWLAQQGWTAHGLDLSPTAIARGRTGAAQRGVAGATFEVADLSSWTSEGMYDLVTASFFHSPVELSRTDILRGASDRVAPGGHLLLVTHAAPPPWAGPEHVHRHDFLTAQQELDELSLDAAQWTPVIVEDRPRRATGPDGQTGDLLDGVVLVRRR